MDQNDKKILRKRVSTFICAIVLSVSMCSCKTQSNDTTIGESIGLSETTTLPAESSAETEMSTTEVSKEETAPSGYVAYVGETVPTESYEMPADSLDFRLATGSYCMNFSGFEFGFDNPKYIEKVRKYYNDPNFDFYAAGYLQELYSKCGYGGYSSFREYYFEGQNLWCQIAMYIVQSLGLRMYVDEIPHAFFAKNFQDYLDILDYELTPDKQKLQEYGTDLVYMKYSASEIQNLTLSKDIDVLISKLGYASSDNEILRMLVFSAAYQYNTTRCWLAYSFHDYRDGEDYHASYVKQVRTTDGKNVLLFKKHQYEEFVNDMHYVECYKNIDDLYTPLTEEDLVKAGVDKEKFKYIVNDLAGVTFTFD